MFIRQKGEGVREKRGEEESFNGPDHGRRLRTVSFMVFLSQFVSRGRKVEINAIATRRDAAPLNN